MGERDECVSGCLGKDPEEMFGHGNERYAKFSVCVEGYDEGKQWYDVKARGNLADFVLSHLTKGARVLVRGRTTDRAYSYKGEQRVEKTLRAEKLTVGADECELEVDEVVVPERNERREARERVMSFAQYPHRWNRGVPQVTVPDEDLEVTPHDEATVRIQDLIETIARSG